MFSRQKTLWEAALVFWAAVAILFITIVPVHRHDSARGVSCNVCRVGHLPALHAPFRSPLQAPAIAEWHNHTLELTPAFEPVFACNSPRAPPA